MIEVTFDKDAPVAAKPWGHEKLLGLNDRLCLKLITVQAGQMTSLQRHSHKVEFYYVLSGYGYLHDGVSKTLIQGGQTFEVKPGQIHRIEGVTPLTYVEATTPELDDIERLHDMYGRGGTPHPVSE